MDSAENFDRAEYGLVEFRLQCRDGLAFVCLDPGTPGLEQWLGDFPDIHWPWALDQLVSTRVQQLDVGCNWKAFIEVFNEYYHLPFVHPDSLNGMYGEPDPADLVLGQYTTQFGITDGSPALFAGQREHALPPTTRLQGRLLLGTRYTWVYPNLTFAAGPDSLWMYEVYPRGAGRCHVVQTICFPPNAVELEDFEERARYYYARHDEALAEDLPALERQQRGLGSPFARQGRFADLEPGVGNFGCWYARAMRLGAGKTID
jgi:phenylpropionate dioxygenase-like ring-hydroxylating dioxygenase large terminal subunit